jgi:hypothetical protein
MRRSGRSSRLVRLGSVAAVGACLALGSCAGAPEERCATIGRAGGLLFSADNVLTIALPPEALDEDIDFCVVQSERGPDIYGNAYRVYPNPALHFAAQISYRFALPDDTSEINIGRVDAEDFAAGMGEWVSLDGCRVESGARLVSCEDDEIAKFYGLLDDYDGPIDDSNGETTADSVGPTTNASNATTLTTAPATTVTDTNADTGDESSDTGNTTSAIDYPPECDDLPPADPPVEAGTFFTPIFQQPVIGSDDFAADGQGGFVSRDGNVLARLDVTGATLGTPNDPGFDVAPLDIATTFATATIGMRYRANGDLLMMMRELNRMDVMHPDGSIDTLQNNILLPTRLFVDPDGIVWASAFQSGNLYRYDVEADDFNVVGNVPGVTGILYDPLRRILFMTNFAANGSVWRLPISGSGDAIGEPEIVTDLGDFPDALAMDECGNLYVVDQDGNQFPNVVSGLSRVFMDDDGEIEDVEEIFADLEVELASPVFAYGEAYGDFQTALFMVGLEGIVYYVDVHVRGAAAVVLDAAPAVSG